MNNGRFPRENNHSHVQDLTGAPPLEGADIIPDSQVQTQRQNARDPTREEDPYYQDITRRLIRIEEKLSNSIVPLLEAVRSTNNLYQQMHSQRETTLEKEHQEMLNILNDQRQAFMDTVIPTINRVSNLFEVEITDNDDPPEDALADITEGSPQVDHRLREMGPGPSGVHVQPSNVDGNVGQRSTRTDDHGAEGVDEASLRVTLDRVRQLFESKLREEARKNKHCQRALGREVLETYQTKLQNSDILLTPDKMGLHISDENITWFDCFLCRMSARNGRKHPIKKVPFLVTGENVEQVGRQCKFTRLYQTFVEPLEEDAELNNVEFDYNMLWEHQKRSIHNRENN